MKNNSLTRLLMLILALSMVFSLFACNGNEEITTDMPTNAPTEAPAEDPTEDPTQELTEAPTQESAEAPTQEETEEPTESETETEYVGPAEPACETCTFKTTNNLPICTVCGYVAECRGEHGYSSDINGHKKPACDKCGKGEGRVQNHEYSEIVEDEGDLLLYSYICDICQFSAYEQEVPYEINIFYPASEIANFDLYKFQGEYAFDSGIGYGKFVAPDEFGATGHVYVEQEGSMEDDPSGQYLVAKMRLPRSVSSITLEIQSYHATGRLSVPIRSIKSGWVTMLIDLAKVNKITEATAEGEADTKLGYIDYNGEYYLKNCRFTLGIGGNESFDLSYVFFCEEYEDAMAFIENERNIYIFHDIFNEDPETKLTDCKHDWIIDEDAGTHTLENPCYICGTSAVEAERHTFTRILGAGGDYAYACAVCGTSQFGNGINVNRFFSAQEVGTTATVYYQVDKGGVQEDRDGTVYGSFKGQDKHGQVLWQRAQEDCPTHNTRTADIQKYVEDVGSAEWFVLKLRCNSNQKDLSLTFSTTGKNGPTAIAEEDTTFPSGITVLKGEEYATDWGTSSVTIPLTKMETGKWIVYVLDLKKLIPDHYVKDPDTGTYMIDTFYFTYYNFASTTSLDFAYMAFVDNWEEVDGVVSENEVYMVDSKSGDGTFVRTDGVCAECNFTVEKTVDNGDGTKTVGFACSNCGKMSENSKTYSIGTTIMSPEYLATASQTVWYQVSKGGLLCDEGSTDTYMRMKGQDKVAQLLYLRHQNDFTGDTGAPLKDVTYGIGNATHMVIRVRTNNVSGISNFGLMISTTGKNGNPDGSDANAFPDSNGYTRIDLPTAAMKNGEWTVFVADLTSIISTHFVKDAESGKYVLDTFYFDPGTISAGTDIDISYIAFIEGGWKEIDAYVDEEQVISLGSATGAYGAVKTADGKCLEHSYAYGSTVKENGDTHYAYACAACGEMFITEDGKTVEQTVSADVNWFASMNEMNKFRHGITRNVFEDGVFFTRYYGTSEHTSKVDSTGVNTGNHLNITGGGGAGSPTVYTIECGKYLVFKYRVSGLTAISLNVGNETRSGLGNQNVNALPAQGEWRVAVVDLSSCASYTVGATDVLNIMFTTSTTEGTAYTVDFAYFAIVDSIEEAKTLMGEGEKYMDFGTDFSKLGTVVG